jgi:hypothetical protein
LEHSSLARALAEFLDPASRLVRKVDGLAFEQATELALHLGHGSVRVAYGA